MTREVLQQALEALTYIYTEMYTSPPQRQLESTTDMMMRVDAKVIRSEEQHQEYLLEIERLIACEPQLGSPMADDLELLSVLVEAYENQKYPIEAPDPINAILFRMQEQGLKQADLAPYFGTRSRVSEVLARKRPLTVNMIRALSSGLGISTKTLVGMDSVEVLKTGTF